MASLPTGFTELAMQRLQEARRFWGKWRTTAREEYAFVAGDQWEQADITKLQNKKRPIITFNYSEKMIDAVVGAEVSSRQEITYAPRKVEDSGLAELWTNAAKWVRDLGNIEDEESDAFRDALICGLGWTHTKVSYDTDPDGMIETHRVDPLEVLPDPSSRKPGLTDRRYAFWERWVDEREARKQWPNILTFDNADDSGSGIDVVRQGHQYDDNDYDDNVDAHKDQVRIHYYECVELVPYFRVQTQNGFMSVDSSAFSKMREDLDKRNVKYVRMQKRKYYFGWFSGETLLDGDELPTQEGFTLQCITGKRDRNKNIWYGLTRVMKDPQRWANKWLSQILHIINSNAKGGLLAERNAFVDPKKAQEDWADPEGVVFLSEGGINKIKEKEMATYPAGLDKLMQFALGSLPQVTGINLEALGLAGRDQANVLEQSRKQAAYGLLAPVFNSLRLYRKNQGRIFLDLINTYIADDRMVRIGGPESQQFVPLRKAPEAMHYDVVIDQSPNAPDVKEKTWQTLENLIPAAMKAGMPVPPGILKYAPIPTALAMEWQQAVQTSQNQASPQQMQALQEQIQKDQQTIQQLQQQLADKSQELALKRQQAEEEAKRKREDMQFEHETRMAELQQEMQMRAKETEANMQMRQQESFSNIILKKQEQDANIAIAAHQAANQPKPTSNKE